jgi:RND superfamily putative drug exporter
MLLDRLGRTLVARRRAVLALTLVFVALAGVFGGAVASKLKSGGFDDPNAEATHALKRVADEFGGQPDVVLLVRTADGVDDLQSQRDGAALTARAAADPHLSGVGSYWTLGKPEALRSTDGRSALVLAKLEGGDQDVDAIVKAYTGRSGTLQVRVGGLAPTFRQVGSTIQRDLAKAELIAIPITFVLLMLVFGSLVAALLPLAVAGVAVLGSFLAITLITGVTDVSIFALNLITAMGLGLAIDYALFMVSRFREEVRHGLSTNEAVVETLRTAGRTVIVSALTVALSLSALLVFPLYFLRSFAYAGIAVVLLAMLGAVVVLPALLAALGPNVDRWQLLKRPSPEEGSGFWHRTAELVMRRPGTVAITIGGLMLALGLPFLNVSFGLPDDRVLPKGASTHQVADVLRTDFPDREADATIVLLPGTSPTDTRLDSYASALSTIPDVSRVDTARGGWSGGRQVLPAGPPSKRFVKQGYGGTWVSIVPTIEARSEQGQALVHAVRDTPAPGQRLVGGPSADLVDTEASISSKTPLAAGLIVIATLVILFLFTGSVLIPIKAVVLNLLSLSATFGAMVYVFQEGHLQSIFGHFTITHTLDTTTPILMFCIAFGLSMDYEVFLLSRIREEWLATGDNRRAVALGLERTGRLVTAAAALIAVVFTATATSGVTFIRLFGVGMALAVVMDATLVRGALVPAFMRIAGKWNWWAPAPLTRVHRRFGLGEPATTRAVQEEMSAAAKPAVSA